MSKTRAQIRAAVISIVRRDDIDSDINTAIDFAIGEIGKRHIFRKLRVEPNDLTLSSGNSSVALDTVADHLIEARVIDSTNSYHLSLISKKEFVYLFPNVSADTAGAPEYAYVEDGTLYVYPKADDDYTIRTTVARQMDSLSDDSDTPEVDGVDAAIVAWAASWIYDTIEMPELANRWLQRYEVLMVDAIKSDRRRPGVDRRAIQARSEESLPSQYWLKPFVREVR